MGLKVEFFLVVALIISCCGYSEAKNLKALPSDQSANGNIWSKDQLHAGETICEMCEQYSTIILSYLNHNETQTEFLALLYDTCSKLQSLRQQCITLVDYYVPLVFTEFATISPDEFCERMHLCKATNAIKLPRSGSTCTLCNKAVLEILIKLQDPSTQLMITKKLIKRCSDINNDYLKCYEQVKQYAPEGINYAKTFLQKADVCAPICNADVPAVKYISSN